MLVSLPRMRGDRPALRSLSSAFLGFTPHARGSTFLREIVVVDVPVYPACAGIDLLALLGMVSCPRLPRMRGDRPFWSSCEITGSGFTPHARGSTFLLKVSELSSIVYPACAGIDLLGWLYPFLHPSLPRMRGDRPARILIRIAVVRFTPHARGSTDCC